MKRIQNNTSSVRLMCPIRHLSTSPTLAVAFDAVFVINLKQRSDRWASLEQQLRRVEEHGSRRALVPPPSSSNDESKERNVFRFPAYDFANYKLGTQSTTDLVTNVEKQGFISEIGKHRMLEVKQSERIWGMDLTPGGIGCALSHFHIWSLIVQNASRWRNGVLVLEDDSLIKEDFLDSFADRWQHVPKDWELVYLSGLDVENKCPQCAVAPGVSYVPALHRTTNAYVINPRGAQNYLRACVPLTVQLDSEMTTLRSGPLPAPFQAIHGVTQLRGSYTLSPPLIVQATRFGSDIQDGRKDDATHDYVDEERSRCKAAGWDEAPPVAA